MKPLWKIVGSVEVKQQKNFQSEILMSVVEMWAYQVIIRLPICFMNFPHRNQDYPGSEWMQPIAKICFSMRMQHFFCKDAEHPYVQEKPLTGFEVTK
jgi:hypothetical protein